MITPDLKNFGTLFENYSFRVPNYQRSYEWKQQAEIDDFWLDLFDYYERKCCYDQVHFQRHWVQPIL